MFSMKGQIDKVYHEIIIPMFAILGVALNSLCAVNQLQELPALYTTHNTLHAIYQPIWEQGEVGI